MGVLMGSQERSCMGSAKLVHGSRAGGRSRGIASIISEGGRLASARVHEIH